MILCDTDIREMVARKELGIDPFDHKFVQPASYDMHLAEWVAGYSEPVEGSGRGIRSSQFIDVTKPSDEDMIFLKFEKFVIFPGEFVLASTIEEVWLPADICGRLEGKSSLGRLGLTVHVTAGFIDPGFKGHVTLEIANLNNRPIRLYAGMPIAQMSFSFMNRPARLPYGVVKGSKYQDQGRAPVPSQYWKNYPDKFLELT